MGLDGGLAQGGSSGGGEKLESGYVLKVESSPPTPSSWPLPVLPASLPPIPQHSYPEPGAHRIAHLGDAGFGQPPEHRGVGETEAAGSGPAAVPGEPVAPGRAGGHPAAAAAQRTGRGSAGGGKEAPRVPGTAASV